MKNRLKWVSYKASSQLLIYLDKSLEHQHERLILGAWTDSKDDSIDDESSCLVRKVNPSTFGTKDEEETMIFNLRPQTLNSKDLLDLTEVLILFHYKFSHLLKEFVTS